MVAKGDIFTGHDKDMYTITNENTQTYKNNSSYKIHINVFDSPEEYAEFHRANVQDKYNNSYNISWGGGLSSDNAQTLIDGDTRNLAKAEKILSKLEVSDILTDNVPMLETCIAGFAPNVPAYLAGQPEAMLDLVTSEQPNVNAPIRIFVETTVSSAVTHAQLMNRGVATLAFVMAMNTLRPVELYTVSVIESDNRQGTYGKVIKLASAPLDLARAVFMLTEPGFARALLFPDVSHLSGKLATIGPWPFNSEPMQDNYTTIMRDVIGMNDNDIFLKGGYLFDNLMLSDPIAWVNKMVREHSNTGK